MKKKDKVTLKGVDKPEPFQHWTETINARILKAMVLDQLKSIKKDHPEVLEQFIKEHYGK